MLLGVEQLRLLELERIWHGGFEGVKFGVERACTGIGGAETLREKCQDCCKWKIESVDIPEQATVYYQPVDLAGVSGLPERASAGSEAGWTARTERRP